MALSPTRGHRLLVPLGALEPEAGPLLGCGTDGPGWGQAGVLSLPASPYQAPTNAPLQLGTYCPPSLSQKRQHWALGCRRDSSGKEYFNFFNNLFL